MLFSQLLLLSYFFLQKIHLGGKERIGTQLKQRIYMIMIRYYSKGEISKYFAIKPFQGRQGKIIPLTFIFLSCTKDTNQSEKSLSHVLTHIFPAIVQGSSFPTHSLNIMFSLESLYIKFLSKCF